MQEPDESPDRDSKTHRKKQMLALQKIGELLVALPASELARINLESPLAEAVDHARTLKSHEAKRRQLQYIGKLIRHVDVEPIAAALEKIQIKNQLSKTKLHQVEQWRDKLIAEGDEGAQAFLQIFPNTNLQELRQLIRNAQKAKTPAQTSGANTALFRYLRDVMM